MTFDASKAAAALHEARLARRTLTPLGGAAPRTEQEGAAVQPALAALQGAAPPGGFKVGAIAKVMQAHLGLHSPAAGFMAARDLHPSGATLAFAGCVQPGVECELAVRLAEDLPPGPCTIERAAAAVGQLMAAMEVVENRYGDLAAIGTPTIIADQFFHRAAILGDPGEADWRTLDAPALRGRIEVDGAVRGEGVGADLLGHPLASLAWLAASPVAAAFGGLRAGQVVMLGSVTPPIWLDGPARAVVTFERLPPVALTLR